MEHRFKYVVLFLLLVPGPAFARPLPKVIQVLEKEPHTLKDIEQLLRYNWPDKAWVALQHYSPEEGEEEQFSFLKASTLAAKGRFSEALPLLGNNFDSLKKKAQIFSRLKRYSESLNLYEELLKQAKGKRKREKLKMTGFMTALEAKEYERGLKFLDGLSGVKSDWWRGWCHYRLGNLEWALGYWQKIPRARSFGFYRRALFWRGTLLQEMGRGEESQKLFDKLLDEFSNDYYSFLVSFKKHLKMPLPEEENYPQSFETIVKKESKHNGIDRYLVFAIVKQESHFNPEAQSPAGAFGLMQIIPQTALMLAKSLGKKDFDWEKLFDPGFNLRLGCHYTRSLKKYFSGQRALMIASYNAGEGAVRRWLSLRQKDKTVVFIEEIPYDETREYTQKVLANFWIYRWLYQGKIPKSF